MQWEYIKSEYSTFVFDCDGVILDSNHIKSNAFAESVKEYDIEIVSKFVAYHKANGGVTRQAKFEYFCKNILGLNDWKETYVKLLADYSAIVSDELSRAALIPGVVKLLTELSSGGKSIFVVTGGSEVETKAVLADKGIACLFDDVLGNPTSKLDNMNVLKNRDCFDVRSFYFGDSKLDQQLAMQFSLDFLCIYGASDWENIPADVCKAKDFLSLIETLS